MTQPTPALTPTDGGRQTVTLERTFVATVEEVWGLWTTKAGIESWWGPDGFSVEVRDLDLRAGGRLHYALTATDPAMVEFMTSAGMPTVTETTVTYTEVEPMQRLAYTTLADFIPGVEPYDIAAGVVFQARGDSVHMVLTFDAMHDEQWTERAVMGHESQLSRLTNLLERRASAQR